MALSPGTHIGPYEVSARIGAGGMMGEVYRARASGGTALKVGTVLPLFTFNAPQMDYPYDVTPDGRRVLVAAGLDAPGNESIQVVVNWSPAPAR